MVRKTQRTNCRGEPLFLFKTIPEERERERERESKCQQVVIGEPSIQSACALPVGKRGPVIITGTEDKCARHCRDHFRLGT